MSGATSVYAHSNTPTPQPLPNSAFSPVEGGGSGTNGGLLPLHYPPQQIPDMTGGMQAPGMLMDSQFSTTTGYMTPMSHETSPTALLYDVGARLASVCEENQHGQGQQGTSPTFQHQQPHHIQQQGSVEFYSSSGGGSDLGMGGGEDYRIDES